MNVKHQVLIVDDHTLVRASLRALLSQDPEIEIVGEAGSGRDAMRLVGTLLPQLVLMDLTMPGTNGIEAIVEIKRRYPKVRILVLTLHKAEEYIHESLKAGADGYVLKDATHDELCGAIRNVLAGKPYLSPDISRQVITGRLGGGKPAGAASAWDTVTHRERQVLKLVAEGHPNKSIADYLYISGKTVEKHRSNLMKKLELHSIPMLTRFAIDKGLVASESRAETDTPADQSAERAAARVREAGSA
jgi:DNA-binding NarL/FixJ family response regulator